MLIRLKHLLRSRRAWIGLLVLGIAMAPLWYFTAYPRGKLMAYFDQARGHEELRIDGYPPPWYPAYARLLKDKYGVDDERQL